MSLRFVYSPILAALVALALMIPAVASAEGGLTAASARAKASNFSVKDISNKKIKFSKYKGKVVLLTFWATWCKPCLQELKHFSKFQETYGDDLVVLAISTDDASTAPKVRSTAKKEGWVMPVIHDQDGVLISKFNPKGNNPYSVYIDRAGRIALAHEGFSSGDEVKHEGYIKSLLAEKP